MKIYYSCLTPQEDDVIYIHYRDIISRPCVVNLTKLTQQDIEMFTSIKDTDMNLSRPKRKRAQLDYSRFESNEDIEPKPKKQIITRPGREPSAQRIAAQKLITSSQRKKKTPMQILKNTDFDHAPINIDNPLPVNIIIKSYLPEQEHVAPRSKFESAMVDTSSSVNTNLQTNEMEVNDNITQENTINGSDSDATVEYTPPPDPPNSNILDGATPKGRFHNKLCGIKKGKKKRLYYWCAAPTPSSSASAKGAGDCTYVNKLQQLVFNTILVLQDFSLFLD